MIKNASDKIFLSLFKNKLLVPWYSIDSDSNVQQRNEEKDNSASSLSVEESSIRKQPFVANKTDQSSTAVYDGLCAHVKKEKRITVKQEDGGIEFEQMTRQDQDLVYDGLCAHVKKEKRITVKQEDGGIEFEQMTRQDQDLESSIRKQSFVANKTDQSSTAVYDGLCAQVKKEKRITVKQEDGGIEFEQMTRQDQDQGQYRRFTPEEKKELSLMRFRMRKQRRQREKEMAELEAILRKSGDILEIYDDPEAMEMLMKRTRGMCANSQRGKYPGMISEKCPKSRRRLRQISSEDDTNDNPNEMGDKIDIQMIQEIKAKKAEISRIRYHKMSPEEKKEYNKKRTETSRRRRMKEVVLLSTPKRNLTAEQLDRVQRILACRRRQSEAAKLHYQRKKPVKQKQRSKKRSKLTSKRRKLRSYAPIIESSTEDDNEDDDTEGTLSATTEILCRNDNNIKNKENRSKPPSKRRKLRSYAPIIESSTDDDDT